MTAWNYEDLTGRRFARVLVDSMAEKNKNGRTQCNCICDCGERFVATAYNLKNGNTKSCGCYQKERSSITKIKDIIGNRYTHLLVKEKIDTNNYLCVCDCGNEIVAKRGNLVSGNTKSCGCLARELTSKRVLIDMTGAVCGDLTVIKLVSKVGDKKQKWLCKCKCGIYTIVDSHKLRNGHTKSCGHLRNSKPESIIVHYLKAAGIKYDKEYIFDDLLSAKGYPLRFDFKIYTDTNYFLLEYQGQQHFRKYNDGFGDQQRLVTDIQKKEYCKTHNIELVEIRFDEDIIEALEKILNNHNLLHDNPVPSSE